jgi:Protein of unknown function (DUF2950)
MMPNELIQPRALRVIHHRETPGDHMTARSAWKRFSVCCRRAAVAGLLSLPLIVVANPAGAQQSFPSPDAAAAAFTDALATNDPQAMGKVLGSDWRQYIPTAGVDMDDVYAFLAAWAKSHKIVPNGATEAHLAVGDQNWILPIPIVTHGDGWHFDTVAAADEIRTRRIGSNELAAMQAALGYYDAQKEYALVDRNGDGVLEYAQRILSTPGKHDGLYWTAQAGEPESPLGPAYGDARSGHDYHGYNFKILTAQGPHAPGGAYGYRIQGRMVSGFALVAWPAKYGDTGVMTFLVSHDGQLYEQDLGRDTGAVARAMTRFDPGPGWRAVSP